jgi:hypothetical protein
MWTRKNGVYAAHLVLVAAAGVLHVSHVDLLAADSSYAPVVLHHKVSYHDHKLLPAAVA